MGEILGFADQLGGARDLGQRRENPPRRYLTQPSGQRRPGQANQQQDDPQLGQHSVDGVQWARELDHTTRKPQREQAKMAAIDMNVCEQAGTAALSDRLDAAIPRQPDPTRGAHELTIRSNDLPVLRRPTRLRGRHRYALTPRARRSPPAIRAA